MENSTQSTQFTYEIAARTDKGMQRTANEDSLSLPTIPECDVSFLIADGMGGLRAGDLASNTAIETITRVLQDEIVSSAAPLPVLMAMAIGQANDAVNALAPPGSGEGDASEVAQPKPDANALMGTTIIIGLVQDDTLYLAHAGDSRVYRLRNGVLNPLTEDHSYVYEQIKAGNMTEEEARRSKFRNIITRAVGIAETVEPEVHTELLREGDLILACSDGLTTMLTDSEILALLKSPKFTNATIERQVEILIETSNKRGGHDNITIALLRVNPKKERLTPQQTAQTAVMPLSETSEISQTNKVSDLNEINDASNKASRRVGKESGTAGKTGCLSLILIILSIVGAATLLGMLSVMLFPKTQALVATRLGAPAIPSPMNPLGLNDFTFLEYEKPRPFGADLLVRGDILSYTQGAGLFCVLPSTGRMVCLNKEGNLSSQHVVYNLPIKPSDGKINVYDAYTVTDPAGNVYVSLPYANFIQKLGPDGRILASFTGFKRPEAVAIDEEGSIYVVDNERLKKITAQRGEHKNIVPTPVPILTYATPSPRPTARVR